MLTKIKETIMDSDVAKAWLLSWVSVSATVASWINLINGLLTTAVLVGTVYLTIRKVFYSKGKDEKDE